MKHLFYGAAAAAACGLVFGVGLKIQPAVAEAETVSQPLAPVVEAATMDSTGSYYLVPPVIPINASPSTPPAYDADPAETLLLRASMDVAEAVDDAEISSVPGPQDPTPAAAGLTTRAVTPAEPDPLISPAARLAQSRTDAAGEFYSIDDLVDAVSSGATPS
ncbi:MAG: hypothetical protein ACXWVJ_06310 [Caulobacteraceae bacterium]